MILRTGLERRPQMTITMKHFTALKRMQYVQNTVLHSPLTGPHPKTIFVQFYITIMVHFPTTALPTTARANLA